MAKQGTNSNSRLAISRKKRFLIVYERQDTFGAWKQRRVAVFNVEDYINSLAGASYRLNFITELYYLPVGMSMNDVLSKDQIDYE